MPFQKVPDSHHEKGLMSSTQSLVGVGGSSKEAVARERADSGWVQQLYSQAYLDLGPRATVWPLGDAGQVHVLLCNPELGLVLK